ncbi:RES domain-containing protein [Polynucleobacter sp. JS-Safj-400b-B2]|uniref:RES domain-containing protein n=1 Tax=Polynucleobacter sp. JS-Safj-400b-B2 TaxID=2576921 RepID=UPI001C0DF350|nr:RES domain-containing protein [Polynucleobacter sp. JS-Safj-400b-B2]MBU3627211.1 RES domain-containing protein [Polynucleobacter sp. JS-Safj-400b-B2]
MAIRKPAYRRARPTTRKKKLISVTPEKRVEHLLEEGSIKSLVEGKKLNQEHIKYQWDFYSELAYQRSQIQDQLILSIQESCITNFKINSWQRVTKWKYSGHPFSTVGSLVSYGGRFNIGGDISSSDTLKTFQALYLAEDQGTAQVEAFGQDVTNSGLTIEEISLSNKNSFVCTSISGRLDRVIDLTTKQSLVKFAKLISKFKIPHAIQESAKKLGIPTPFLIKSPGSLLKSFLANNWRKEPAQFDIPANSQIFGQLAYFAGMDGVVYPSTKTGKNCLAIYPSNFDGRNSFLSLDDEPPEVWTPRIISSENFQLAKMTSDDVKIVIDR